MVAIELSLAIGLIFLILVPMDVFWVGGLTVTYMNSMFYKFDKLGVLFIGVFYVFGTEILNVCDVFKW